jgi:hypothetical protein
MYTMFQLQLLSVEIFMARYFLKNVSIYMDKSFVSNYFCSFMTWKSSSELVDKYQTQTMFSLGILLTGDTIVWKPSHGCLH